MLLKNISHLSFSVLRFAVPRLLDVENPRVSNYRSNYPISGHSASFGLLNQFEKMHGYISPRRSFKFKLFESKSVFRMLALVQNLTSDPRFEVREKEIYVDVCFHWNFQTSYPSYRGL